MSSDPLPLPEIWSDLPEGGTYEGTRAEFVAGGRSGLVLVEYTSGFARSDPPDPQPVVRPIERGEQPRAPEPLASLVPAALAKGLADLTAIVTQAEALLRAQGALKGDVHFAVERIADVAMALRMREVDSALCDMLDASVSEVGDAVVRHQAAATGALSAAALLRDVVRRLEDLTVVASRMIASGAEPLVRQPPAEAEVSIETVAPVATEAEAAIEMRAPFALETGATIETLAPVTSETDAPIESLASVVSEADSGIEAPATVVTAVEATIETAAPVVTETNAGIESLASVVSEPDAGIETPVPVVAEADGTIDAFAHVATEAPPGGDEVPVEEAAAGPEAETLHRSAADAPMARPVDIAISDDDHAPSLRDTASDSVSVGDDGPEPQAIVEPNHDVVTPVESSAAVMLHPQDHINVASELSDDKDEAASAQIAVETASAVSTVEAAASVVAETRSEPEPPRVESSLSAGETRTTAPTKPRRPANDPFAMLHGLSEEELIALFS